MTRKEKRLFLRELTSNVLSDLLKKLPKTPDDWNGIELRQWVADSFSSCVFKGTMPPSRKRKYNNEVLTRNL